MRFLCFSSFLSFSITLALFLSLFTSLFWRSRLSLKLRIFSHCTLLWNSSSIIFLHCSSRSPLICFCPGWSCSSRDSNFIFAISNSCRSPISCGLVLSAMFLMLAAATVSSVTTFRCPEIHPCTP